MLLAVDVGNSNLKFGLFAETQLREQWRIRTQIGRTADEYAIQIGALLARSGLNFDHIDGCVIASVVPRTVPDIVRFAEGFLKATTLVVSSRVNTGIEILYDRESDVGADRLVDSVAAADRYGTPCIVVDFGTATTFNALGPTTRAGCAASYLGGAICPGIGISLDALYQNAAKLSAVEVAAPPAAIGRNTVHALQSGIVFGFVSQVDGLISRFRKELGAPECRVVATGGHLSMPIIENSTMITDVDHALTLTGLRLVYERNIPR